MCVHCTGATRINNNQIAASEEVSFSFHMHGKVSPSEICRIKKILHIRVCFTMLQLKHNVPLIIMEIWSRFYTCFRLLFKLFMHLSEEIKNELYIPEETYKSNNCFIGLLCGTARKTPVRQGVLSKYAFESNKPNQNVHIPSINLLESCLRKSVFSAKTCSHIA